ncbi:MAG: D-glycero-beta-D-manno-heptose-7-phosphate kinase [Chloroherpetonaceae bacterium]|nr:D-glycero-beta-D-manno-heptose-7-phosphate kinase [Chloroherpetonaceae bacterium]
MNSSSLSRLFKSFQELTIAVIGDVMLDKYIFGKVSRISPEAPVPIIDVSSQSYRLGGAANVAINIHALGAKAMLIGVIGKDDEAQLLKQELESSGLTGEFLVTDEARPTTCKTRVIAQNHHIVRIDSEERKGISQKVETLILTHLKENSKGLHAIILEDYNKGVLTPSLITKVITFAKKNDIPIAVDPKHDNFFAYQGVTVFKPNLKETSDALGIKFSNTDENIAKACKLLQAKTKAKAIVLTRSEKGVTVFEKSPIHIPTMALEVADVSGAGDTVIGVLSTGLAAGMPILQATRMANIAAGIVCAEVGAVAVDKEKLYNDCLKHL